MKKSSSKSTLPPYQESLRYMANAEESLKKAGRDKETGEYEDKKYVRTASGIAYLAVLIALDEYLQRKEGSKFKKPKSIEEYRTRIAKQNKKLLSLLNASYDSLHIMGYYYGTTSAKTIGVGIEEAYKLIEYIGD